MIDFQGKTWTRAGATATCEDGRTMAIVAEMTDAYIMGVVQSLAAAAAAQRTQNENDRIDIETVKLDPAILYLLTHTPAEINAYVTANATNLATAVGLLSKLAQAVSVMGKQILRMR